MANHENRLSLYGENTNTPSKLGESSDYGYIYACDSWKNISERANGEHKGVASSQRYNSALKQACFGTKLLGDLLIARYGTLFAYDISTTATSMTTIMTDIIRVLTTDGTFIKDNEILRNNIDDDAITSDKINSSAAINFSKLDSSIQNSFTLNSGSYIANNAIRSSVSSSVSGTLNGTITEINVKWLISTTQIQLILD